MTHLLLVIKIEFPDFRTRLRIYQGATGIVSLVGGTALASYSFSYPVLAIPTSILLYAGAECLIGAVKGEASPISARIRKYSGI